MKVKFYNLCTFNLWTFTDLQKRKKKPISSGEAEALVLKLNLSTYKECSAFTQEGLKGVFDEAVAIALEPPPQPRKPKKCVLL